VLLPPGNAIVGIDLAAGKQAAVVTGHDSRVLARRRVPARAWELGELLDWALVRARAAGFVSVTVACEPAGYRWRVLDQLAAQRGLALVCVQPLLVYRAREAEDLTFGKSGPKDAVIIARLTAGLHCYEPGRADAVWARLRHLGARRLHLTADATTAVNQVRDLLECAWPAVLDASPAPFRSASWRAAVAVALDRARGDLAGCAGTAWTGSPRRSAPSCPLGRDPAVSADRPRGIRHCGRPCRRANAAAGSAGTRGLGHR
jgi:transposase